MRLRSRAGWTLLFAGLSLTAAQAAGPCAMYSWGSNRRGQLGIGEWPSIPHPSLLTSVVQAAAGGYHGLARCTDGTVWAWGYNGGGQLGDGTRDSRSQPAPIRGLSGVVCIAAGSSHCLALKGDGTVWAWGDNWKGRLGDGTTTSRLAPVKLTAIANVASVSAGLSRNLAVKSDGTVWAWGLSDGGQLGDVTRTDRYAPVQVKGLTGAIRACVGGDYTNEHSIAPKSDRTVSAWGWNNYGQLGDGTMTCRLTPVRVVRLVASCRSWPEPTTTWP